jgi:predicted DNA-binding transcriptional regulator AlpA
MRTACNGTYERHPDGWRYAWGEPVPGAEDMTISSLYNLPVVGRWVLVPRSLAANEPELSWCLDYPEPDEGERERLARMRANDPAIPADTMLVPLAEWDRRASEPIGMWAPELHPERLLDVAAVARLAGVTPETVRTYLSRGTIPRPQGHLMGSPWWTRPVIERWLAERRGPGRPRKRS